MWKHGEKLCVCGNNFFRVFSSIIQWTKVIVSSSSSCATSTSIWLMSMLGIRKHDGILACAALRRRHHGESTFSLILLVVVNCYSTHSRANASARSGMNPTGGGVGCWFSSTC